MPPPKKAAKKAAKKSPKKFAGHHHDLRRAYEHMGRLGVLQKSLESSTAHAVGILAKFAEIEIKAGHNKDAADLLRASEHMSFAVLAGSGHGFGRISAELKQSITEHFNELTRRADEHWENEEQHSSALAQFYQSSRKGAVKALKEGAYHRALEFARAAEALAHVRQDRQPKLETDVSKLQLECA